MEKTPSVLVVIVYTEYKKYCRFLFPHIYRKLSYENKKCYFVTEKNTPRLAKAQTGEMVAAWGRCAGIQYAKKHNFDYIFQIDLDMVPERDAIQRLMALDTAIAGGMHTARGNANLIIGHKYTDRTTMIREPLKRHELKGVVEVDAVSGGYVLIHKDIFTKIDYGLYKGPGMFPGRHTMEDEYFQHRVYKILGVKPLLLTNLRSWHYADDGFAYRNWGETKEWGSKTGRARFLL